MVIKLQEMIFIERKTIDLSCFYPLKVCGAVLVRNCFLLKSLANRIESYYRCFRQLTMQMMRLEA